MANESYEDFARALQTEYEEDCGVTFGKVPITAIARLAREVDGEEAPIGKVAAEIIRAALVAQKMLEADGRIGTTFDPRKKDFKLTLPPEFAGMEPAVADLLAAHQIERLIRKERDEKPSRLKKEVTLSPDFEALWDKIKPKTTYRVEFETDVLASRAVAAIKKMEKVELSKIRVTAGRIEVRKGGVAAEAVSAADEQATLSRRGVPDVLAYLQNETELTRSTLARRPASAGRNYLPAPTGSAIREAMRGKGMVALGRVVLAKRERIIMLQPWDKGVMGATLRYGYEVRDAQEFFDELPDVKIAPDMLKLAEHILTSKEADFDPGEFVDHYEEAVVELLKKKEASVPVSKGRAAEPSRNVINLMDALKRSIASESTGPSKSKKGRKRVEGQGEMLLPISGKKGKEAAAKPVARPGTRQKKAG